MFDQLFKALKYLIKNNKLDFLTPLVLDALHTSSSISEICVL